jgi:hypothetical protein
LPVLNGALQVSDTVPSPAVPVGVPARPGSVSDNTRRSVPRFTAGRLSPISLAASPRGSVPPEPIRPLDASPKHLRVASSSTAQVCDAPATIARTVRPVPSEIAERLSPSSPGWSPRFSNAPVPSRPLAPSPQHLAVALSSTAHVCEAPALSATAVRPVPSATGNSAEPISEDMSPMLSRP